MFTLVKAGLVIPLNTACVERGFSHHGIIKNKLRSRLKVVNVDSLLRVKLLCRDHKNFDYQRAMELHDSMHNSLISSLARTAGQLQFAAFDEELANEDLVDFTPLPESEPEEDSGFDFSETEDRVNAADSNANLDLLDPHNYALRGRCGRWTHPGVSSSGFIPSNGGPHSSVLVLQQIHTYVRRWGCPSGLLTLDMAGLRKPQIRKIHQRNNGIGTSQGLEPEGASVRVEEFQVQQDNLLDHLVSAESREDEAESSEQHREAGEQLWLSSLLLQDCLAQGWHNIR